MPSELRIQDAYDHPDYADCIDYAVKRAIAQQAYAFSIHWDGEKLRVRSSFYDAPPHSKLACIVQVLDDKVQLRFGGGRIEWRSTTPPSDPRFDGEQPETEEPRTDR
jgi:hypothetical protein